MRTSLFTESQAKEIKRRLWQGETQTAIAFRFKCDQRTISYIKMGKRWPGIEWPNGSTGRMPRRQEFLINRQRAEKANGSPA